MDNGRIVKASTFFEARDYPLIDGSSDARVEPSTTSSAQTIQFTLSSGQEGAIESFDLGRPKFTESVGLAIERTKPFWVTPRILNHSSELSSHLDTQFLLLTDSATVVAILPVCTATTATSLRGSLDGSGHIWLRSERDSDTDGQATCVIASGLRSDLLRVIDECTTAAKAFVARSNAPDATATSYPRPSASLYGNHKAIYCTWNSLGPDYTVSAVLDRLQAMQDAGALDAYNAVLLDDGWQDVTGDRTLSSFGAKEGWLDVDADTSFSEEELNNRDFRRKDSGVQVSRDPSEDSASIPTGSLQIAISLIKQRFPQIQSVGCWLTAQGYWNGLNGAGPIAQKYKLATYHRPKLEGYRWSHDAADITLPCTDDAPRFWQDYFQALKSAGVDFVKVDNQADVDAYAGEGAGKMRTTLLPCMRAAARAAFGDGNTINCMPAGARELSGYLSDQVDRTASMRYVACASPSTETDTPAGHRTTSSPT